MSNTAQLSKLFKDSTPIILGHIQSTGELVMGQKDGQGITLTTKKADHAENGGTSYHFFKSGVKQAMRAVFELKADGIYSEGVCFAERQANDTYLAAGSQTVAAENPRMMGSLAVTRTATGFAIK